MVFCMNPKKNFLGRDYSCGHCPACRATKANEKILKSIFAANEYFEKGQFLTLTYSDDNLPNGLKHSHFSDFMKRLRRADGTLTLNYLWLVSMVKSLGVSIFTF